METVRTIRRAMLLAFGKETVNYVTEVLRTAAEEKNAVMGAMGLAGEVGEFVELIKKDVFHGKPPAPKALKEELGDILWYLVYSADACGTSLEEIATSNVEKLRARYPAGFIGNIAKEDGA
jgi:NTP pyrophosphatase (non-canonical NTP hydrolase)